MTCDDAGHGLRPRALASLRAIAEALFATDDGPPPPVRLAWLTSELDDFFARAGARSRFVFTLSLLTVGVLAPLLAGRLTSFRPLRALPLPERARALEALEASRFSLPLLAVKAMLCVVYYEHADAARAIGFDGECMRAEPPGRVRLEVAR